MNTNTQKKFQTKLILDKDFKDWFYLMLPFLFWRTRFRENLKEKTKIWREKKKWDTHPNLEFQDLDEDCNNQTNNNNDNNNYYVSSNGFISSNFEFDRLDDEQLMSIYSDDMSLSNPSTASGQNSNNDDKPMVGFNQHQQYKKKQQQEEEVADIALFASS